MGVSARVSGSKGPYHGGQFPGTALPTYPLPPHLYYGIKHIGSVSFVPSHNTVIASGQGE